MKKMTNQMLTKVAMLSATALSLLAIVAVTPASVFYVYQGNTPSELLK